MYIKFIKPPAPLGLAYFKGDEAEFEDAKAQKLIESGFAEEVEKPKKGKKEVVDEEVEKTK